MKKYSLIFILLFVGLQGFATGDKYSVYSRYKTHSYKSNLNDSAWNKMHYLDKYPNPTITFHLGGMWLNNNARLRINSDEFGVGTTIDFRRDLGINPSAFAGTSELYLRIGKRHQIVASGFGYTRSKSKTLDRDIKFSDTTFYANASINTKTQFISYNLDYRFSIYRTPRAELGISIGAKLYDVYGRIQANLNQNQIAYSARKRVYVPALLPGIHGSYYLTDRILLRAKAEYLQLTVSDWNFKILEIKPSIEIYPIPNLGVGASYSYFNVAINKAPSDVLNGQVKYIINGTSLFASLRF